MINFFRRLASTPRSLAYHDIQVCTIDNTTEDPGTFIYPVDERKQLMFRLVVCNITDDVRRWLLHYQFLPSENGVWWVFNYHYHMFIEVVDWSFFEKGENE